MSADLDESGNIGETTDAVPVTRDNAVVTIVYNMEALRNQFSRGAKGPAEDQPGPNYLHQVQVFLSSPGDVTDERQLVRKVAQELVAEPSFRKRVTITLVSWDDPAAPVPMLAGQTPQESVNRGRPKPSDCDVVVVILWSRMGTPLSNEYKASGRSYLSGTEWEYENALKATPQPAIIVYRRTEKVLLDADDPNLSSKLEQREQVKKFFEGFRNSDGTLQSGVTEYDFPSSFADRLKTDLRELMTGILEKPHPATSRDVSPFSGTVIQSWTGSPYPGLRAFSSDEEAIFFGRGREVDALITRLRDPAQRFLAVVGASGSGKSSLVRAGLLPRLMGGAIQGSQNWRVLTFTPGAAGDNPFLALASELKGLLPASKQRPQIEIATALAKEPQSLRDFADLILSVGMDKAALVLFVDQFDEIFTDVAETHLHDFLGFLAKAVNDFCFPVLVTLRADFLPRSLAEPILAPLLQAGTVPLGLPGPVALADMIRRPAEWAGLNLEEGLADEILKDAGPNPGEVLPLIAFCLEELYGRTTPKHYLTLCAYKAMGGLRGAISRRIEELLEKIKSAEGTDLEATLPQVFHLLVHVDATGKTARQRVARDVLMAAPAPVPRLINALIDGRLLLTEETNNQATVTLTHEALIEQWPALHSWLEHNRAEIQQVRIHLLLLKAPASEDRRYAIEALKKYGPSLPEVIPALRAVAFYDEDVNIRWAAGKALGWFTWKVPGKEEALEILSTLTEALHEKNANIRQAAAWALGEVNRAVANDAVNALMSGLNDPDKSVSKASADSLRKIRSVTAVGNLSHSRYPLR